MNGIICNARSLLSWGLLGLSGLALACSSGGGGGGADQSTVLVASATVLPGACPNGTGNFPNTTCVVLRIQGQGNVPLEVEVRIIDPAPQNPLIGTVLLGSGGKGEAFYADTAGGNLLIAELLAAGHRVVDRRWTNGWFTTGEGFKQQSARYAALLSWVHDNAHTTGSFCATGNSAGASEITYALTTWDMGSILDRVVLTSGPPLARLDYLCSDPASAEWVNICTTVVPAGVMECGVPICTPDNNPVCPVLPTNPQPGELEANSVLFPEAVLDFPDTDLIQLLGAQDCSSAVPLSLHFINQVTSSKSLDFISGAPHLLGSTAGGRAAIINALSGAAPAPSPPPALQFQGQYTYSFGVTGETQSFSGRVIDPETESVVRRVFLYEQRR